MKGVFTIAWRDFRSYFSGPTFYFVASLYSAFLSYTYFMVLKHFAQRSMFMMMQSQGKMGGLNLHNEVFMSHISNVNLILLICTPFLTVRLFAEEKRARSFDLLLTSPVTSTQIVLGKFLAGLGAVGVLILISMIYPGTTVLFSEVQWGLLFSAYLGLIFLAVCYTAIGIFCSSITESVIVAGFMSIIFSLLLWFIAWSGVLADDSLWQTVLNHLSVSHHFGNLVKGVIETSSIVFFMSLVLLYCFLTQRVVESARWR